MNFELLKENYTKVPFRPVKKVVIEEVEKAEPTFSKKDLIEIASIATFTFFYLSDVTYASSASLDVKARELYFDTFIGIAKWIIIGKGGWDIVTKTLKEDFDGAKRSILQYMIIFLTLLGLPAGLDLIEGIFRGEA